MNVLVDINTDWIDELDLWDVEAGGFLYDVS